MCRRFPRRDLQLNTHPEQLRWTRRVSGRRTVVEEPIEHVFDRLLAVTNARYIVLGLGFFSIQLAPLATLRAF
jgi:hypothetical protein